MINLEHRENTPFNRSTESTRVNFSQSLKTLFGKLADKTALSEKLKIFRTTAKRRVFEENNVVSNICKGLFSNNTNRGLEIIVTPVWLGIEVFSEKGGYIDKKASMGLHPDGENVLSYILITNNNRTESELKNINIGPADCSKILKTVEIIAIEQGLIKK